MLKTTEIVIFDTEFTAWPGSRERGWSEPWEARELIQLAAVRVELRQQKLVIAQSFNELILPIKNPILSDYIVELTGIEQSVLNEMGIDFVSAMLSFHQFCESGKLACYSWGPDAGVLQENCLLHRWQCPDFSGGMHDIKAGLLRQGLDIGHLCSGELVGALGIPLEGHVHNALHDVRSISAALNFWLDRQQLNLQQLMQA